MENQLPVLAEVRRGPIVEARHRGAIIVVEPNGRVVAQLGDSQVITSTRSTIKPIQSIPLITTGAADRFGFTQKELAICCASHQGESIHTEAVAAMLVRMGLTEDALMCGPQPPFSEETARRLDREGRAPSQLHNNCSGKHTGMLATALHLGVPTEDYVNVSHPVQRGIMTVFEKLAGLDKDPPIGVDGCSAPTFGVPLQSLALAFARLANPAASEVFDANTSEAVKRLTSAMIAHPEMVGGTRGRFDTNLLRASNGKLVCKIGAEAVYSIGVFPGDHHPEGLGIALKIEDGSYRGLEPAIVETLAQLSVLDKSELEQLAAHHHPKVDNRRGLIVGEVRPVFTLERQQ